MRRKTGLIGQLALKGVRECLAEPIEAGLLQQLGVTDRVAMYLSLADVVVTLR